MPLPNDLLQPIPGNKPGGANVRYEPAFEKLSQSRIEEEDIDQGDWKRPRKTADWGMVAKQAKDILAKQSKDLQVAAWLTEALIRTEAIGGLRQGLALIHGLTERYWDHLYPAIEDGDLALRAAPLNWVGRSLEIPVKSVPMTTAGHDLFKLKDSRAIPTEAECVKDEKKQAARKAALSDGKLSPEEFAKAFDATPKAWYKQLRADLDACVQNLQQLDEQGQAKFGDAAPSYTKLSEALEEVRHVADQLLQKKLEAEPDPPDAVSLEPAAAAGASGTAAPAALTPEPASVEDAAARIAGAARYLRHTDPRNPAPYLMLRGFRWGELRARGPELNPKLLSAPPTPMRTHLKGLLLDGKWGELLDAGENVMATPHGRGWLDLQRYELTACEALGPDYEWVASAIRSALVSLLRDVPQLPDLTLMDDTPTANAETRGWLLKAGLLEAAAQAAAEERAAPGPVRLEPRLRMDGLAFARAMEEVRAGRPQDGVALLMREAEHEKSPRARFLRRSEAAGIMIESGLETVALPILHELVQQLDDHKLEDWEAADVVARPMALLYRALTKVGGDSSRKDELYRRVCRLDPMQAIAFPAGNAGSNGPNGA